MSSTMFAPAPEIERALKSTSSELAERASSASEEFEDAGWRAHYGSIVGAILYATQLANSSGHNTRSKHESERGEQSVLMIKRRLASAQTSHGTTDSSSAAVATIPLAVGSALLEVMVRLCSLRARLCIFSCVE
jgi:hypothetical protein